MEQHHGHTLILTVRLGNLRSGHMTSIAADSLRRGSNGCPRQQRESGGIFEVKQSVFVMGGQGLASTHKEACAAGGRECEMPVLGTTDL